MFLSILYACLIIQIALSLKLFINNPARKLNIYLSLIPGLFIFSTIIEINLCYITDSVCANRLFHIYQCLSLSPIIFLTLALTEYIKNYTAHYKRNLLLFINGLAVALNCSWIALLIITGPSANIYASKPGIWSIEPNSIQLLFHFHAYSSMVFLIYFTLGFIYIAIKAKGRFVKFWFFILSFFELLITVAIIMFFAGLQKNMPPQYDLAATIPCTIMVALQLWVLSNFTIFDVTPRNVYAEVLASTSDWIAVLDENGKIIYANNAILNKSAYTIYDVTGMQIDQLIAVKASESEKKYNWDSIKKIKHKNFSELLLRFKNAGEWYNVQSYVKKTLLPNRSIAFVWVFIDTSRIESLKLSKEIIATKNIELRKAYDDTVFLMNMTSHDLKTPLKTIMELAEMVKKENKQIGANRSLEYLDYIMSISNESLTFAQQMIEYMRVGVANKKREWCNMDRILIEVKQRLFTQLERSSALIVYKGLDTIFCDARHIKELLTNLIDNAIKYQVNEKPIIEILVSDQGPTYEFLIKDNGIGIHQDFLPHLFSEYSREEKMMTAGSGMGLYLCKKIIEANQGQITAFNNKPNKGITILFTMVKLES